MELTNLFKEIKDKCDLSEIDYVIINNQQVDVDWFLEQAKRIEYNSSYGTEVINLTMKIVLKDGSWIERAEYDGSEWFVKKQKPICPKKSAEKDLGLLFENNHSCPFSETLIDNISIKKTKKEDNCYELWVEKKGQIVIETHEFKKGNYKKIHEELLKSSYEIRLNEHN